MPASAASRRTRPPHPHHLTHTHAAPLPLQVITVNAAATGIQHIRPKSLLDMIKARGQYVPDEEDESHAAIKDAGAPSALGHPK